MAIPQRHTRRFSPQDRMLLVAGFTLLCVWCRLTRLVGPRRSRGLGPV